MSLNHAGRKILLAIVLLCLGMPVSAQEAESSVETRQQQLRDMMANTDADPARPEALPGASGDPQTRALYETALQDYYRYRSDGLQHRRSVFAWQLFSAKLIFVVVLLLVTCGVVFAAIQFRHGLQQSGDSSGDNSGMGTQMELSAEGVKISSPVLGVIILFISLAFFYLYLVYIYPIENIF